jgi:hypothetical protein
MLTVYAILYLYYGCSSSSCAIVTPVYVRMYGPGYHKKVQFQIIQNFSLSLFSTIFLSQIWKCQNLGVRDFVFQISGTSSLINFLPKAFLPKLNSTKQFNIMKCGGLSVFFIYYNCFITQASFTGSKIHLIEKKWGSYSIARRCFPPLRYLTCCS